MNQLFGLQHRSRTDPVIFRIKSFFQFAPTKIELTYCNSMAYSIFSTYFAPTLLLLCPYFATT